MVLDGETISRGAKPFCRNCDKVLKMEVCQSAAGYYLGTQCDCGPYSRETDYFYDKEKADWALEEFKKTGHLVNER